MLSRFFVLSLMVSVGAMPAYSDDASRFVVACKVALVALTEGHLSLEKMGGMNVQQVHRRITIWQGEQKPITCVFRDLSAEIPELEAIAAKGAPALMADDYPQWNEAIWNHFVPSP